MTKTNLAIAARIRQWFRTIIVVRKTTGKKKHVNDIPDHILQDIGLPDSYSERMLTPVKRAEQSRRESSGQYESTNAPNRPELRPLESIERVTSLNLQNQSTSSGLRLLERSASTKAVN